MALKEVRAIVKYIDNSQAVQKELGKFITRAVGRSALHMEFNIKESAKVSFVQRTGHVRRSVLARYKDMPFGKAEVQINPLRMPESEAQVNYAQYLEFGTKFMAPRAFIRKGVGWSKKGIKEIFAQEAKQTKDTYRSPIKQTIRSNKK